MTATFWLEQDGQPEKVAVQRPAKLVESEKAPLREYVPQPCEHVTAKSAPVGGGAWRIAQGGPHTCSASLGEGTESISR